MPRLKRPLPPDHPIWKRALAALDAIDPACVLSHEELAEIRQGSDDRLERLYADDDDDRDEP